MGGGPGDIPHPVKMSHVKKWLLDPLNLLVDPLLILQDADPGFGQGGPQLLRLKVAEVAKQSCMSKASYVQP